MTPPAEVMQSRFLLRSAVNHLIARVKHAPRHENEHGLTTLELTETDVEKLERVLRWSGQLCTILDVPPHCVGMRTIDGETMYIDAAAGR
jgi:hypothetical protein